MIILGKEKNRIFFLLLLFLSASLFSNFGYSQQNKLVTRIYAYKGEFDVEADGSTVTVFKPKPGQQEVRLQKEG